MKVESVEWEIAAVVLGRGRGCWSSSVEFAGTDGTEVELEEEGSEAGEVHDGRPEGGAVSGEAEVEQLEAGGGRASVGCGDGVRESREEEWLLGRLPFASLCSLRSVSLFSKPQRKWS